ncbi:MAG TPA: MFS transporter [Frankiaceae bacterium]|nr:MFS transporter [Frankiaceae bacterium]
MSERQLTQPEQAGPTGPEHSTSHRASRAERPKASNGLILAIVCLGQFMVVLDVSIVNVALPAIGRDLHYSSTGLQWVVNGYVLTFAGFLLLGGRLADLFGQRKVFLGGLGLFSLASLLGGLAQNSGELTAARALQGLGGAVLSPATLTIITTTFTEPRERTRAIGIWSSVAGAGGAFGAIAGGVLTTYLSWRWVLYVNVPIGALVALGAFVLLHEVRRPGASHSLDVAGSLTGTGGLAVVVYAIVSTDTHPWGSARTLITLAIGLALLAVFLLIQARFAKSPLMPLSLFRSRSLSGANVVMLLAGIVFFAMWYFQSLWMQEVLGFGPLRTGLLFLPMTGSIIIASQLSSRLVSRFGARPVLMLGMLFTAAGFLWMGQLDATSTYANGLLGGAVFTTFGVGLSFTPLAMSATSGVPPHQAGLASGLLNTSRQVGGSIGLAALATLATARTQHLTLLGTSHGAALTSGYDRAFQVSAAIALVAVVVAALSIPSITRAPRVQPTASPGH